MKKRSNTYCKIDKNKIMIAIFAFINIVFSCIGCGLYSITTHSSLFSFTNSLNNYYDNHSLKAEEAPIINISKENTANYSDLFLNYYYCEELFSLRYLCNDSVGFANKEHNFSSDIKLFKQNNYSINELYDFGYYIDYGLFSAYYDKEIFGINRGWLDRRFNTDGFLYISDVFADQLLSFYSIDSYADLILNEEYCVLYTYVGDTKYSFCINNILYSNERTANRVTQLYGENFALCYYDNKVLDSLNWAIELDFKSDYYGTSRVLKGINTLDYKSDNSSIYFKIYDKNIGEYKIDEKLSYKYSKIDFNKSDLWFFALLIALSIVFNIASYIFLSNKNRIVVYAFNITLFIICGIIVSFFSFSYGYLLYQLINLIIAIIFSLFMDYKNIKCSIYKLINPIKRKSDYEINI